MQFAQPRVAVAVTAPTPTPTPPTNRPTSNPGQVAPQEEHQSTGDTEDEGDGKRAASTVPIRQVTGGEERQDDPNGVDGKDDRQDQRREAVAQKPDS
ncbi:MAG TPA: hypothetical protein VGG41_08825 [Solirubrobacteraceae bacterium]